MFLIAVILFPILFAANAHATIIGSASIHAPAVILENNTGSLTIINLTVETGNGTTSISGPATVAESTLGSAENASIAASSYLSLNHSRYNFMYSIQDAYNVSGPSAGTAMALLAISALSDQPLRQNFSVTGTISPNGSVGEIGGIYDKVNAAASSHMINFMLVPQVPNSSFENEMYVISQSKFQVPLVQVSNLSEAANFAFGRTDPYGYASEPDLYTDYNVSSIKNAGIQCSADCNATMFSNLVNFTFNYVRGEINALPQGFSSSKYQFGEQLNQSIKVAQKGFLYTGADFAFLDFINAFTFKNSNYSISGGFSKLSEIKNFCNNLAYPQITSSNYEYVIAGELRQSWGNYTASTSLDFYNSTAIDSDGVIENMYTAGEAEAWCKSSQYMYNESVNAGSSFAPLVQSAALQSIAAARINRAVANGPNMYLATARLFYGQGNYMPSIIDADYAYALYTNRTNTMSLNALLSNATYNAHNATYGMWATQFANEAMFYVQEANLTSNYSQKLAYADEAYTTSLLAYQVSNDTKLISSNLVAAQGQPAVSTQSENSSMLFSINYFAQETEKLLFMAIAIIIALAIIIIVLLIIVLSELRNLKKLSISNNKRPAQKKRY